MDAVMEDMLDEVVEYNNEIILLFVIHQNSKSNQYLNKKNKVEMTGNLFVNAHSTQIVVRERLSIHIQCLEMQLV